MKVNGVQVSDEVTNELRAFIRDQKPNSKLLAAKIREVADRSATLWKLAAAAPALAARMPKAKATWEATDAGT